MSSEPRRSPSLLPESAGTCAARARWGWTVTLLGLAVILWGVLHFTSATVGGRVHEFKERRTYGEVKLAAHRAFPVTLLLGFAGLALVLLGGKLRAASRGERREA